MRPGRTRTPVRRWTAAANTIARHEQGPLRHRAFGQLHLGELPRGPASLGQLPGRQRGLLLRGRPARADHGDRAGRPAGQHPRCRPQPAGHRPRPRALQPLRAEPRPRAHPADLAPRVHHGHGRAAPHDPVQGQGEGPGRGAGRPLHLPGAHGGRHPALRRHPRPGGRRPAPAPRAHPGGGRPLQQPLRRDLRRPRGGHPRNRGPGHGPPAPRAQDVQVGRVAAGHHRPARLGRGHHAQGAQGGHRHRRGDALRPGGQARAGQPARPAGGGDRPAHPTRWPRATSATAT